MIKRPLNERFSDAVREGTPRYASPMAKKDHEYKSNSAALGIGITVLLCVFSDAKDGLRLLLSVPLMVAPAASRRGARLHGPGRFELGEVLPQRRGLPQSP